MIIWLVFLLGLSGAALQRPPKLAVTGTTRLPRTPISNPPTPSPRATFFYRNFTAEQTGSTESPAAPQEETTQRAPLSSSPDFSLMDLVNFDNITISWRFTTDQYTPSTSPPHPATSSERSISTADNGVQTDPGTSTPATTTTSSNNPTMSHVERDVPCRDKGLQITVIILLDCVASLVVLSSGTMLLALKYRSYASGARSTQRSICPRNIPSFLHTSYSMTCLIVSVTCVLYLTTSHRVLETVVFISYEVRVKLSLFIVFWNAFKGKIRPSTWLLLLIGDVIWLTLMLALAYIMVGCGFCERDVIQRTCLVKTLVTSAGLCGVAGLCTVGRCVKVLWRRVCKKSGAGSTYNPVTQHVEDTEAGKFVQKKSSCTPLVLFRFCAILLNNVFALLFISGLMFTIGR